MSDECCNVQAQAPVNMAAPPSLYDHRERVVRARIEAQQCLDYYAGLFGRPMMTPAAAVIEQLGDQAERILDRWDADIRGFTRSGQRLSREIEALGQQVATLRANATEAAVIDGEASVAGLKAEVESLRRAVTRYAPSNTVADRAIKRAEQKRIAVTLDAVDERHAA